MSGKVKMRCARCGKSFKSSGAKQTLCPDCEAKARQERASAKATPAKPAAAPAPVAAPRIVGPGAGILVPELKSTLPQTSPAPADAALAASHGLRRGPNLPAPERPDEPKRTPERPAPPQGAKTPAKDGRDGKEAHERKEPRERQEARPPKEPRQPQPTFELTDELRAQIEARYLELATPAEFDGIRTRIAQELAVPKSAVKRVVLELRKRMNKPSWWELQPYAGDERELARIRAAYEPHLPVPPVGVHKQIASELGINTMVVYQAIHRIRTELSLPQYNAPEAHAETQTTPQPLAQPTA